MPSWKIHLHIASQLSISVKNKDAFLLANIAPDIENGWILKDIQNYTDSAISHFYKKEGVGQELPDTESYSKRFQSFLKTDVVLGYYIHLLTDYFWNNILNKKLFLYNDSKQMIGIQTLNGVLNGDKHVCTAVKQKDFQLLSDSLVLNEYPVFEKLSDFDIKNFEDFFNIPSSDLQKASHWIKNNMNPIPFDKKPLLFTQEQYMCMIKDCQHFIETKMKTQKEITQ